MSTQLDPHLQVGGAARIGRDVGVVATVRIAAAAAAIRAE